MPKPADVACRRACFVASIQSVGKAVLRNRAKRRLREVFRRHQELLPASVDMMFVARSRVNERSLGDLDRAFMDACGRMQRAPSP
jgi:ribonuclease P protein component